MALKENLIALMNEKKITIRELSNRTNISEPTLKKLRTSLKVNPTLDVLIKITKALDVSLNELIESKSNFVTIVQGEKIAQHSSEISEFIYLFTKDTFNFTKGTKAIFRKYINGDVITKYVLSKDGMLYQKVENQESKFKDEKLDVYFLDANSILAYIIKELYEVNYA
jgi:DNA-binding Xre family transcriptional regulator